MIETIPETFQLPMMWAYGIWGPPLLFSYCFRIVVSVLSADCEIAHLPSPQWFNHQKRWDTPLFMSCSPRLLSKNNCVSFCLNIMFMLCCRFVIVIELDRVESRFLFGPGPPARPTDRPTVQAFAVTAYLTATVWYVPWGNQILSTSIR